MPHKNDIQKILVIGFGLGVVGVKCFSLPAQVDCVSPSRVFAIRNQGLVVDPFGTAVPTRNSRSNQTARLLKKLLPARTASSRFSTIEESHTLCEVWNSVRSPVGGAAFGCKCAITAAPRTVAHNTRHSLHVLYVGDDKPPRIRHGIGINNSNLKETEEKNATQK